MAPILKFVDQEVESESSSHNSNETGEVFYIDAEEFLPQLEKDIGIKGGPRIAIKEVEIV